MKEGIVWTFNTARLTVYLEIERIRRYRYDGDDENGETQAKLDSGDYIAFDSWLVIELDGVGELARNCLSGLVYSADDYQDFWTAHHGKDPMNRNCSIMRAAKGRNVSICHYFPDMVREAINDARQSLPRCRGE